MGLVRKTGSEEVRRALVAGGGPDLATRRSALRAGQRVAAYPDPGLLGEVPSDFEFKTTRGDKLKEVFAAPCIVQDGAAHSEGPSFVQVPSAPNRE